MIFEDSGEKYVECKPSLLFCIWFVICAWLFFIFGLFCHFCLWTWIASESRIILITNIFSYHLATFFQYFFREIRKAKGGVTKRNLKNVGTWFLKIIRLFILQNNVQHLVLHVCYNVLTYYQSWCIWDLKALISKNRSKAMESWIFS